MNQPQLTNWDAVWAEARLDWIERQLDDVRAQQIASAQYYTRLCEERADLRLKRDNP